MEEIMEEGIKPVGINMEKATIDDLKKIPLNSGNALSVTKSILKKEEKIRIKINSTERDKSAVFVGINGHAYNIPRDTWVEVPKSVLSALNNAVVREYHVNLDAKKDDEKISTTETQRFGVNSEKITPPTTAAAQTTKEGDKAKK